MAETLNLVGNDMVTVESATEEALDVEARYAPAGNPPPAHLHPAQDERFEVREGEITTRIDGVERVLKTGETVEIPRGTPHQMWNAGSVLARVAWRTAPALRTLDWFRALDALQRGGPPDLAAFVPLLEEYADVVSFDVSS